MKKLTSCISMILLGVLALASVGHAGERAGAFSVSPFVGGYLYDEDEQPDFRKNRPLYGLRLGYDWTDHFATELVGHYVSADWKPTGKNFDVWSYRLDLLYNFMPQSVVVPYIAMGGGATTSRFAPGRGVQTDGTFNGGGGVKFFMTDNVALRADARHILVFPEDHITHNIVHNWEYSAGLSFVFGGAEAAAEVVESPAPVTEAAPAEAAQQAQPQEAAPEPEPTPAPAPAPAPVPAAEPTPGHYKYCVTLQGEFDIDQAVIRAENRDEIARVGEFMKKYPTTTAVIEGHSDNVGTYNHNMELSQRRAESVVNHLVDQFGIDRSRLVARGYGLTRPIADNSTNEGRQKNRRIEAIIDCAFDVQQIQPPERLCMALVLDFDSGKADVKPQYRDEISKVADYMKQYPTTTAVIEGHTDSVGNADSNMKLSQQRADNVVKYLSDNFGIERSRLSAKGYGDTRRISYEDTPEGRQQNRRINAVIDCVIQR